MLLFSERWEVFYACELVWRKDGGRAEGWLDGGGRAGGEIKTKVQVSARDEFWMSFGRFREARIE